MASTFELYHQRTDGSKGLTIARGDMRAIVDKVRRLGLLAQRDIKHPLGIFYVNLMKEVYVVDFVTDL